MPKDQVTAESVTQAVLQRITTGQFAPGDRLPSIRDLAEELGSNRNTVNKAYQALLDLGVIESNGSGRRGFSVRYAAQLGAKTRSELLNYFYQQSVDLVWQGMAAGISSEEVLEQLRTAVVEVFGLSEVRLIFYECNEHDTVDMGRRLNEVLGMPVEYKLLAHFYKNPPAVIKKYDLIITTYHHLAEITDTIKTLGFPPGRVVGIDTRITADTMLRIARFSKTKIGVVSTNQNTAHMLKHILYGYHPEWEIEAISLEEGSQEKLRGLVENSDHIIVTHTCADEVLAMTGRTSDVVVNFQIDEQSIAFLNQRIHQLRVGKMEPLHSKTTKQSKGGHEHESN